MIQIKQKGHQCKYAKITGDEHLLVKISRRTHEPIKPEEGLMNPRHVDFPERKLNWIQDLIIRLIEL
jgi:hypothetical protein